MNTLFAIVFILSTAILLILSPDTFLSTLLAGASKSATLCLSLLATYAVWLGLMKVWEDCGISRGVSKGLKPLARRLFKTDDEETLNAVCMNLSVNLLGISGAATPYGIRAAQLLDRSDEAEYSSSMLFVLNATSIQLIPTSIIGVRVALGSAAPADILIPTLLTTVFSTVIGLILTRLLIPPKHGKKRARTEEVFFKKKGAGTQ
ncbi:MAG: spore maturation protein A [Clostridia bacterium]|nr:spore maturation protein A [Clostridia bacterium]